MKRYSGLQAIYMSFFSKDLYRDVVEHWKGISFLYLFLWTLVSALIAAIMFYVRFSAMSDVFVSQLPNGSITHGKLTIDKPSPYYIKDPTTGVVGITIDTTGDVKNLDQVGMLFTGEGLILQSPDEKKTYTYTQMGIPDVSDLKKSATDFFGMAKTMLPAGAFIGLSIFIFILRAACVLVYGAIGIIISNACKANLTYGELLRISVVALTPWMLVEVILKVTSLDTYLWLPAFLLFAFVTLGYVFFGVKANAEKAAPPAQETPPAAA